MAKQFLLVGTTSFISYVRIADVNGSPITGLVYNSTGLASKYILSGAASASITLATQTTTGAYSSGGFVEMDATAFPGLYRFDIPNAALASGNTSFVSLYGYTGMAVTMLEFELVAFNPQDTVRLGLTALPNVASGSAGAIPTTGTGANQIKVDGSGLLTLTGTQTFNNTGTWTGNLTGSVGSVTGSVGSVTGAVGSVTGNVGGNVTGSVGSVLAGVTLVTGQLFIKKNTSQVFPFVMVNSSGVPTTGLTVTATRSIDGAAFGACSNAVTEVSNGWYKITLSASDTNGTAIAIRFTATGASDRNVTVYTQS